MYSISATGLKSNPKLEQQNLGLQGKVNQGVSKFESLYPQKTKTFPWFAFSIPLAYFNPLS